MSDAKKRISDVQTQLPGPESKKYIDLGEQYEAQCTGYQAPLVWDHANGAVVTDVDGNSYIDWTSGVLVTNVGHCHPHLVKAIQTAAERLLNCYDFPTPERVALAKRLVEATPPHLKRAFFLTTGSEATESAIRVAKRHTGNFEIVSFYGGFHGRTYAAMSVGGLAGVKKQFGPLMPGVIRVPYPYCYRCPLGLQKETCCMECFDMMEAIVQSSSTGSLAGVIVEPYQGASGFIFPPDGWLSKLEAWTRKHEMVFILDEVQSSYGRTGTMWAMEWEDLTPDMVCIGKGIGSGYPISALMATDEVLTHIGKGEMSSTSGGNPVSCAAAHAVLDIFEEENLVERGARLGAEMMERLQAVQEKCPYLGDVRGRGMVMGMEFVRDKETKEPAPDITLKVIDEAAQHGVLVGKVGVFANVIRVAPPLTIGEDEMHESLDIMEKVLTEL